MNMNLSMGFLKPVTNFFKKYTALLPAIIITVVALVLVPLTMLIGKSVKEQMSQKSVRMAGDVSRLMQDIPSRQTPQLVKNYMNQLEEEANRIETMAAESSTRELISYDVFPTPRGTSQQLYTAFGRKYRTAVETMVDSMHALDAPSDAEIRNQTGDVRQNTAIGRTGARTETLNPMVEALCQKRSQEISVYAHPAAFPWYDFWENYQFAGQQQALEDCWDTQVAFWIYQDVADTIIAMNAGSNTVASSPVKRLMGVSFIERVSPENTQRNYNQMNMGGIREIPNYVVLPESDTASAGVSPMGTTTAPVLPSNFMPVSLTGRSTNEDVDVVHFAFSVLVDNRYVMDFMKELCSEKTHTYRMDFQENGQVKNAVHNQISILDTQISAVDKTAPEHELYRYGDGAVMLLDLVCEYQFNRKGYDAIKPDPIKERLGQKTETEQQQQQQQGAVPSAARRRNVEL